MALVTRSRQANPTRGITLCDSDLTVRSMWGASERLCFLAVCSPAAQAWKGAVVRDVRQNGRSSSMSS